MLEVSTFEMHKCLINLPDVILSGARCEIFECLFGLKEIQVKIYFFVLKKKRTIKDIANHVGRDRTTVVRLVQGLMKQGLLIRETELLENGGIRHVYAGVDQKSVKQRLKDSVKEVAEAIEVLVSRDWSSIPYKEDFLKLKKD